MFSNWHLSKPAKREMAFGHSLSALYPILSSKWELKIGGLPKRVVFLLVSHLEVLMQSPSDAVMGARLGGLV